MSHRGTVQTAELLGFYRSDTGRRYQAFQKRLIAIQVNGSSAFMTGIVSGGGDPKWGNNAKPSPAQLEGRKKLIALSWVNQFTPKLGAAGNPSHGASASDDKAMNDMMIELVAKTRGPELDALRKQYRSDLAASSTFQESPAAKALIAVYGDVASDAAANLKKPGADFKAALDQSVAKHTPAWKAASRRERVRRRRSRQASSECR
jgi:hypothetical protein